MNEMLSSLSGKRVLLGVSSSIAAYRALDLASLLRKSGAEVRAVLTENTTHIVGAAAFDAITHNRTIVSLWDSQYAGEMDHLAATKWADVFVVCPATANTLATLAHGLASDALGTFAVSWNKGPMLIAPAMNPEMYRNAAVAANIGTLQARGHIIIEPATGRLACDDVGQGRLAPVEEIAARIAASLEQSTSKLAGKTVLVTCGPTREFADAVRCITNPSSGKQGLAIAEELTKRGARVVLVHGPLAVEIPAIGLEQIPVTTADEMLAAVLKKLDGVDIAIFAAAVSDWKPVERSDSKLKKNDDDTTMDLQLVRTPDIAAEANRRRRPEQVFVGFAAETENLRGYAGEKMRRKGFALVFANPINEQGAGFQSETNRGLILKTDGSATEVATASKREIAARLLDEVERLT